MDLETADLLIRAGAKAGVANNYGVTPLWEACNNRSAAMVEKLAKAGANPSATLPGTGETVLMRCARTGNADAVKSLLAHGADVNGKENQKGQTALMWALEGRHLEVARTLIEHASRMSIPRLRNGFTPLLSRLRPEGGIGTCAAAGGEGRDVNEITPGWPHSTPLLVGGR